MRVKEDHDGGLVSRAFLIRPDQLRAMKRIGRETGISLNEVLRRLIDVGLRHWPWGKMQKGGGDAQRS